MNYFLDTEFIEYPCTIDLISIGIVAEDGREFYAVSSEFDETLASEWVKINVLPILGDTPRITRKEIAHRIIDFIGDDESPEFWGYYADYDWVVFMWLFGSMVNKPFYFPSYCKDIKQLADFYSKKLPFQTSGHHNALEDARWNKRAFHFLMCR
jgi:hypothetical protein